MLPGLRLPPSGLCSGLLYQAGALASQLLALEAVVLSSHYTLGSLQQALKILVWAPFQTSYPASLAWGPGLCLLTLCIGA